MGPSLDFDVLEHLFTLKCWPERSTLNSWGRFTAAIPGFCHCQCFPCSSQLSSVSLGDSRVWAKRLSGDRAPPQPAVPLNRSLLRPSSIFGSEQLSLKKFWIRLFRSLWTTPGEWCLFLCWVTHSFLCTSELVLILWSRFICCSCIDHIQLKKKQAKLIVGRFVGSSSFF